MAHWYNETIKQYVVAFAKPLSDIHVKRVRSDNTEVKDLKVPLVYASKNKLSYILQRKADTENVSSIFPLMGFNISGIDYNPERKLSSLNEITVNNNQYMFEGTPYDIHFDVAIKSKYQDDMYQILEQILYFFKPDISLEVKEINGLDMVKDVKIRLESIGVENELELTEESSRHFQTTLSFVLEGNIYPSIQDSKFIYDVYTNLRNIENLDPEPDDLYATINASWQDPDKIIIINEEQ